MNPRYLAYCKAHGMTPGQMMEHDRARFTGGTMCGFILWNSAKVREFSKVSPGAFVGSNLHNHRAYVARLNLRLVLARLDRRPRQRTETGYQRQKQISLPWR